jgi:uncharacterized protein
MFFVLTYTLTWAFLPFGLFLATGPLIAALIVIPLTQGRAGLRELGSRIIRWRVRWYWYVVAIGLPLTVLLLTVGLNVALGAGAPSLAGASSLSTILMVFAVRLINPLDGPMGEEPGWRGFALPGLQGGRSPLVATLILALLVAVWHVPLVLQPQFGLQSIDLLSTVAVTFWYSWLFNRTGGSVLLTIVAHSTQGSIQYGAFWSASADVARVSLLYAVVASAVAIGLVIFDWKAWRGPAAAETTTLPVIPPREATPVAP